LFAATFAETAKRRGAKQRCHL